MKLKLQLIIESDTGEAEMVREVTKLERYALRPETLGLTLSEAKELLQEVQRAMACWLRAAASASRSASPGISSLCLVAAAVAFVQF